MNESVPASIMRNRRRTSGLTALAAVLMSTLATAQDDGPIVIGEDQELRGFVIEDVRLAIDFYGQYQVDDSDPAEGESTRDTELLFRESVEIAARAFVGHPNLLNLTLSGRFGLEQFDIDSQSAGTSERTSDTLIEYDLLAEILRNSQLPVSVYARQTQQLTSRQFGPTLENSLLEFGGIVSYRSELMPTRLQIFHREQDQTSPLDGDDYKLTQDTIDGHGEINLAANHLITWDFTFDSVEEGGFLRPQNAFERYNALITDEIRFGSDEEHDLRSSLFYLKETGDFSFENLRLTEVLRLEHSPRFETRYDYTFDSQTRGDQTQTLHLATARLRHQLFESLVTNAEVGGSVFTVDEQNFESTQLFTGANVEYTKEVPYGRLLATASINLNFQDDSERGSDLFIFDEVRSFGATGLIILERRNIVASSIVITSTSGITFYTEGLDYLVRGFEERVEIRRVLGGAIGDGETVLIDYRIGPEPASTTDTIGIGGTVRYSFDEGYLRGLSVYARYFEQTQSRSGATTTFLPENDIRDLIFGADYDIWNLSLNAEYEVRRGSFSPFDALRLEAYYNQELGVGSSLVLSAVYHDIQRTDDDINTTILTTSGRWNQQWTTQLRTGLWLIWREETDSSTFDTQAFEQQLDVTWNYRQTSAYASVRNSFVTSDVRDSTFQTYAFGLRREF